MNNPSSIKAANDKGLFVFGNQSVGLMGHTRSVLIKLDSSLNIEWMVNQPERFLFNPSYSLACTDGGVIINDTKDTFANDGISQYSQGTIKK